jgi:hypothetical protein
MTTSSQPLEHEIINYIHVQKRLGDLQDDRRMNPLDVGGIPIVIKTNLSKALDAMSCVPFTKFPFYINDKKISSFAIGDVPASNLYHPDINLILQKSLPSAFGRGPETIISKP